MNVQEYYVHELNARGFTSDPAQQMAVDRLQQAYDDWVAYKAQRSSAFKRLINRPTVPKGVYMWGGVGRGKSFLMDSFYSVVPVVRKTRLHFHEFMRAVHGQLDELKGVADPLDEVAKRIAKKYRLICFDEFHVSDIADAMILYNLLKALFDNGVSFVMTSNYEPSTLYPDGLHRDRMLPTIALLQGQARRAERRRRQRLPQARAGAGRGVLHAARMPRPTAPCATPTPRWPTSPMKTRSCTSRTARSARCAVPAA